MICENQPVILGEGLAVVGDGDAVGAGDRTLPEDSGEAIVDSSGEAPAVTQVAESGAPRENRCANAQGDLDSAGRSRGAAERMEGWITEARFTLNYDEMRFSRAFKQIEVASTPVRHQITPRLVYVFPDPGLSFGH
jgi:hypothetical protein